MNIPRSISQPRKTSSLLHQVNARYNCYEYCPFYKPNAQNKLAFTAKQVRFYTKYKHANNYYEYSPFYKPTTQWRGRLYTK